MFGHYDLDHNGDQDLPAWEQSLPQQLLYSLADRGCKTIGEFGVSGLAALELKAAELHHSATAGLKYGKLMADLEQTNWDAAETLAWLNAIDAELSLSVPHREADATVCEIGEIPGSAYWNLEGGDVMRCGRFESIRLRQEVAAGKDPRGQLLSEGIEIPQAVRNLVTAAADYIWTIQGKSVAAESGLRRRVRTTVR